MNSTANSRKTKETGAIPGPARFRVRLINGLRLVDSVELVAAGTDRLEAVFEHREVEQCVAYSAAGIEHAERDGIVRIRNVDRR